jgi:hypothetical protein
MHTRVRDTIFIILIYRPVKRPDLAVELETWRASYVAAVG